VVNHSALELQGNHRSGDWVGERIPSALGFEMEKKTIDVGLAAATGSGLSLYGSYREFLAVVRRHVLGAQ
jgi:hypothetical protein